MRDAVSRILLACCLVVGASTISAPPPAAASTGVKVAIIVGPTGSLTDTYRSMANRVADLARDAGATVAKAYSPRATWPNVVDAVRGANVVVYFGHGNGYPSPYSSTEWTDRVNGWGLNRSTSNGDSDDWSRTMVYCGEKALLGRLGAYDGAAQRRYCTNGELRPADGFVMIYGQAHYAPGFGERYSRDDPKTPYTRARQRVRNYSFPILRMGGSAFYATAYGDAHRLVARLLNNPSRTFGWAFRHGVGYDGDAVRRSRHPDLNARIFVQKTSIRGLHFGQPDWWYAFVGRPYLTPRQVGITGG